jgi:membrane fusion protein (multidrug efflux system)
LSYEEQGAAALEGEPEPMPGVDPPAGPPRRSRRERARAWRTPLMIALPVLLIVVALVLYLTGGRYVATDDAYVQSARASVASNVSGQVVEVDVHDNQFVHKGDALFRLDPRPFEVAVEQSQARLATAQQDISAAQASYTQRGADVQAGQSGLAYAQREFKRQAALAAAGVSSQSQLDAAGQAVNDAKARLAGAQAAEANALAMLGGKESAPITGRAEVRSAQAAVDTAKLDQDYGVIRALQDGVVAKVDQLQVGDFVTAGQPLFTLAAPRLWVEANFKEDQLAHMRPGQAATVKIDAYPGQAYRLYVASFSPGTGNSFSVLPAENATGNWVKVVQRLPVRLDFDEDISRIRVPLAAGLSAKVTVDTAYRRQLFGFGLNHRAR